MKYIQYFQKKLSVIPISITKKTVEDLLIRLFSAFTELVESQIAFLNQSNKLHLVNNKIPLLQFIRGNFITVTFYTPAIYSCELIIQSADGADVWQGISLDDTNTVIIGDRNALRLINTVLIPPTDNNTSGVIDVMLYGVTEVSTTQIAFDEDNFIVLNVRSIWSESIELSVQNIKWRRVNHVKEATTNSFIVTLNEFQEVVLIFPKNKPRGLGSVSYNITSLELNSTINNIVINGLQTNFESFISIKEVTTFTTLPTTNNLKELVRLYYENMTWTLDEVERKVQSITGILKAKAIRVDTNLINLEISTEDNSLVGYLGLIDRELEAYYNQTGDEVIVKLITRTAFNINVNINGVIINQLEPLIEAYINNNTVLKLGDIYQLIENNIEGSSQITKAELNYITHVSEMNDLILSISSFQTIQETLYIQIIAVTSTSCYIYQFINGQGIFIGRVEVNGSEVTLFLPDESILKISLFGIVSIGATNYYEIYPSLLTVGELEPNYNFELQTVNINYI